MSEIKSIKQKCPLCESDLRQVLFKINSSEDKVAKCLDCGVLYRFFKEKAQFLDYSDDYYTRWGITDDGILYFKCKTRDFKKVIRELKKIKPNGLLIDIGCSSGEFISCAKNNGYRVIGVEPHKKACEIALNKGLDVINADFLNVDIKNNSADVVSMIHVLEHVTNPGKILKKARIILKSDGILLIEIPILTKIWLFLLKGKHPIFRGSHVLFFTKKQIISLLEKENFKILKVVYSGRTMSLEHFFNKILSIFGKKNVFAKFNKFGKFPVYLNLGFGLQIFAKTPD